MGICPKLLFPKAAIAAAMLKPPFARSANFTTLAVPPIPQATAPSFAEVLLSAADDLESPLLSRPLIADATDSLTLKKGVRILPATHNTDGFFVATLRRR